MNLIPRGNAEEVREFCEIMMRVSKYPEWRVFMNAVNEAIKDSDLELKTAARDKAVEFERLAHITIRCSSITEALESIVNLPMDAHRALQRLLARSQGLDSTPLTKD